MAADNSRFATSDPYSNIGADDQYYSSFSDNGVCGRVEWGGGGESVMGTGMVGECGLWGVDVGSVHPLRERERERGEVGGEGAGSVRWGGGHKKMAADQLNSVFCSP